MHGVDVVLVVILVVLDACCPLDPVFAELEADLGNVKIVLAEESLRSNVSPVLTTLLELTKTMTDEPISYVVIDVDPIHHDVFTSIEKDALGVQERIRHLVHLLEVVVIDLTAVTKHHCHVSDGKAQGVDRLSCISVSASPEPLHGMLKVVLEITLVLSAVLGVVHAVIVESSLEETVEERFIVKFVMSKELMIVCRVSSRNQKAKNPI